MIQDVVNRSFLKSHALYKTIDNRKTLEQQNALIAKRLDESLAARNKLYEANRKHHLEVCDMKRQIKILKEERSKLQEEKSKLQEQLQIAQACEYLVCCLDIALTITITELSFYQVLQVTILDW
jgi:predicted nuclease with TOPRIM domain